MKQRILVLIFTCLSLGVQLFAQQSTFDPHETVFDFWVGDWELHWFDTEGNKIVGSNRIDKILDGRVLQEHFDDPAGRFRGTSISVLGRKDGLWHQSWADNQGGYFEFTGIVEADRRIFQTDTIRQEDGEMILRMVFKDIEPNSLTWDWQRSRDKGKNWESLWTIYYTRKS